MRRVIVRVAEGGPVDGVRTDNSHIISFEFACLAAQVAPGRRRMNWLQAVQQDLTRFFPGESLREVELKAQRKSE